MGELLLCRLYTRKVEIALLRGRDRARNVLLCLGGHRVERASCSGYGSTVESPRALGEAPLDLADDGGDLRHIVNLPVKHGSRLVLHALGGEDVEQTVALLGDNTNDAARADVQCKNKLRRALATQRRVHHCGLIFFRASALFGSGALCLLLHVFFWASALLCGRVCGHLFICFIQIRHFDLPRKLTYTISMYSFLFRKILPCPVCELDTKKVRTEPPRGQFHSDHKRGV